MKVTFYDKDKKVNVYSLGSHFKDGACGCVYKLGNDTCLKWFDEDIIYDEAAFSTIMDMNLEGFYKIYKMLYDANGRFAGYTMKFYEESFVDIVVKPIEYTMDNLNRLYKSIEKLTDKGIFMIDFREANLVKGNNDITAIDTDLYLYKKNMKRESVALNNIRQLYQAFSEMYFNALGEYHYVFNYDKFILDDLFCETDKPHDIHKKLVKYKYPLEYIKDMR